MHTLRLFCVVFPLLISTLVSAEAPDASLKACQDEVAKALVQINQNYKNDLRDLLKEFQSAGDLDGFLAVRDEIARFDKTPVMNSASIVKEPELLAIVQSDFQKVSYKAGNKIARKYIDALLPAQKTLTKTGKIDEAMAVRAKVRALQTAYKESFTLEETDRQLPDVFGVSCAALIRGFTRTEEVANRLFKERLLLVDGVVHHFDRDFSHGDVFNVYLSSNDEEADIQAEFAFKMSEVDAKRSQLEGKEVVTLTLKNDKDKGPLVLRAGMPIKIQGRCEGKHINVIFSNVEIPEGFWPVAKGAAPKPAAAAVTATKTVL